MRAWAQATFFTCDPSVDECRDLRNGGFQGDPFNDDFDNFDDFDDGGNFGDPRFNDPRFDDAQDDFDDEFRGNSSSGFSFGDDLDGGFQVGDDFNDGFNGNPVRIQRFDLQGNGCPSLGSTRVFLDGNGSQNRLRVQFGRNGGSFLQVNGANVARSCTARARVLVDGGTFVGSTSGGGFVATTGGDSEFRLRRLVAGVRFVNDSAQGQLLVRTQSRVEGVNGPQTRLRLPNDNQVRASAVRANQNLNVVTDGDIQLLSIIQLETRNADGAIIRLENLDIEFDIRLR
jgi:hypothetical protein